MIFGAIAEQGAKYGIWTADGTSAGTLSLGDTHDLEAVSPFEASVAGNALFFPARDETHGIELWRTEGTPESTRRVRDIADADLGGSQPSVLVSAGDRVYFFAHDDLQGFEPWRSDGTEAGSLPIAEIEPGPGPPTPPYLPRPAAFGSTMVFRRNGTLWRTDGTAAGTSQLASWVPLSGDPQQLTAAGNAVFFVATSDSGDRELWRTDGTVAGTAMVADLEPGPSSSNPTGLIALGGVLYFTATTTESGAELWRSDGTVAGTHVVADLVPGPGSSFAFLPTPAENGLYFVAVTDTGIDIWRTDGTATGTLRVAPMPVALSSDSQGIGAGSHAFFLSRAGIAATDGTVGGTRKLAGLAASTVDPSESAAALGDALYFRAPLSATIGPSGAATARTRARRRCATPTVRRSPPRPRCRPSAAAWSSRRRVAAISRSGRRTAPPPEPLR
jgi:ELWxxDGT repeat protein